MHIVVLGAGALGVYFGGRLIEAGHHVTFLVRDRRAEQIRKNGLKIFSVKGDYVIDKPNIVTNVEEIEHVDFVFLSVKGYHLKGTLSLLKELVKKGAYILPVLNGIEHIRILKEELSHQHVDKKMQPILGGLSFIIATLDEKGHVHHTSHQHKLIFGPLHSSQETFCEELNQTLQGVKIESEKSHDILLLLWDKYMFITSFSGVTATVNLPIGPIRNHTSTFDIGVTILEEMKQLANYQGVSITDEHVSQAKSLLNNISDDGTSSMHQDKRKGLPLELDHLHGAALRLSKESGIDLPMIEFVYHVNKPFANGSPLK